MIYMSALGCLLWGCFATACVDGPSDNVPENVRRIPKLGIEVPAAVRAEFEESLGRLRKKIDLLEASKVEGVRDLLPDVEVFYKAVHDALAYQEFFEEKEFDKARAVLKEGYERADALARGDAPWTRRTGLLVRGYRSKIDHSVQPFGLMIPESYVFEGPQRYRTDIWFHGRGETLSELNFVSERMQRVGEFSPRDTIVLHPYGRYCNAFKFAGEVDVYEALESTQRYYKVDEDRVSERGFSMGGAAAWQFAVHDPMRWFAANPGAGFSETPRFLDVFQNETLAPTWYEKTLWNLYDCDKWAGNIRMVPTVAYSGEKDKQKQAADVMAEALLPFGIELTHIVGKGAGHNYTSGARLEVERRLEALERLGRERNPQVSLFTTSTLRYDRAGGLRIDALEEHWKPATVGVTFLDGVGFYAHTTPGIRAFSFDSPPGRRYPAAFMGPVVEGSEPRPMSATVDQQPIDANILLSSDGSYRISFHKEGDAWKLGPLPAEGLRKKHGLQGPIDDAFMDSFLIVKPTGTSSNPQFAAWCDSERNRAIEHWRRHFRGEARVKNDTEITDADISECNLVLWGDPSSNILLKKIADQLPISWTSETVKVGEHDYESKNHALIAIYPNPLNPERYVVLNSGFTFRDYDYLNNARQTPKLPDWAVVNLDTAANSRTPGKVVAADFFDEAWRVKSQAGRD
jgi:hypothetical protein